MRVAACGAMLAAVGALLLGCSGGTAPAIPDGGCAADYAGCTSFVDATDPAAGRTIMFQDFEYTPKCLRVRVGQAVEFVGDFVHHPLRHSCGPAEILNQSTGTSGSFTFTTPGFYGYYCLEHGNVVGQAMAGAITVAP